MGDREVLDLFNDYLDLVGLDGDCADDNPVPWQAFDYELKRWWEQVTIVENDR